MATNDVKVIHLVAEFDLAVEAGNIQDVMQSETVPGDFELMFLGICLK